MPLIRVPLSYSFLGFLLGRASSAGVGVGASYLPVSGLYFAPASNDPYTPSSAALTSAAEAVQIASTQFCTLPHDCD